LRLLGKDGGKAKGKADLDLIVPSRDTARVQEAHTFLLHALLDAVDYEFAPENARWLAEDLPFLQIPMTL